MGCLGINSQILKSYYFFVQFAPINSTSNITSLKFDFIMAMRTHLYLS